MGGACRSGRRRLTNARRPALRGSAPTPKTRVHHVETRQPAWATVGVDNRTVKRGWTRETAQRRGVATCGPHEKKTHRITRGSCSGGPPKARVYGSKTRQPAWSTVIDDTRTVRRWWTCDTGLGFVAVTWAPAPAKMHAGRHSVGPRQRQQRASTAPKHARSRGRRPARTIAPSDVGGRATLVRGGSL